MNITKQYIEELKKIAMNYECISGEIVMPILAELGRLLEGENVKKTIYNTLTEHEQIVILQYIADRIRNNEIDVDLLPRWLMSLHEEHLELQKLKEETCEWLLGDYDGKNMYNSPEPCGYHASQPEVFIFCPNCGKRIVYSEEK